MACDVSPVAMFSRQGRLAVVQGQRAKGRLSDPLSMNFWKSSKRPLTPPPGPFLGKMLRFFATKFFGTEMTPPKLASQMLKILQRNFLDRK